MICVTAIVLGNLSTLTTEEDILRAFELRSELSTIPMRCVKIRKSNDTSVSCGTCYVELNNVTDSIRLYSALKEIPLLIEGREGLLEIRSYSYSSHNLRNKFYISASVSYSKTTRKMQVKPIVAEQALAAAQWSVSAESPGFYNPVSIYSKASRHVVYLLSNESQEKIEELAKYSATLYANTPEEHERYLAYYREYYRKVTLICSLIVDNPLYSNHF